MYNLSKDYEKLFEFICNNKIAVGFVDYKHQDFCMRDVCQIRRDKKEYISIGVRGYSYGSIYPFCIKDSGKTEKEYFIWLCSVCNLEFVLPKESEESEDNNNFIGKDNINQFVQIEFKNIGRISEVGDTLFVCDNKLQSTHALIGEDRIKFKQWFERKRG